MDQPAPSSGSPPAAGEALTGTELAAVARIWKRDGRRVAARFGGASMAPTIPPGTEVLLACGSRPAVGDIAAVLLGGRVVVHRVIARAPSGTWLLTRGDATAVPDPPLTEDAVIGRVEGLRAGDRLLAPPPPPSSRGARTVLAVCLVVLRRSEGGGRLLIRLLWAGRRWLLLRPRALARRAAASSR